MIQVQPETNNSSPAAEIEEEEEELEKRSSELSDRLSLGGMKIEEARAQGNDVTSWENHWIALLHQYEEVCDQLKELRELRKGND